MSGSKVRRTIPVTDRSSLQFIAAVAEFAEILRDSYWARDSRLEDVKGTADLALDYMEYGPREEEFLSLVDRAIRVRK